MLAYVRCNSRAYAHALSYDAGNISTLMQAVCLTGPECCGCGTAEGQRGGAAQQAAARAAAAHKDQLQLGLRSPDIREGGASKGGAQGCSVQEGSCWPGFRAGSARPAADGNQGGKRPSSSDPRDV